MTYKEKLLDPRWQKKRLEIFQRDDFMCRRCLSAHKTLHVHHKFYLNGKNPWEYDESALITLCDTCHEVEELIIIQKKRLISNINNFGFIVPECCPACGFKDFNNIQPTRYLCTLCKYTVAYKSNN